MNRSDLEVVVADRMTNTQERYGQAVFNTIHSFYPEVADNFRGSPSDCFYQDDKVDDFCQKTGITP